MQTARAAGQRAEGDLAAARKHLDAARADAAGLAEQVRGLQRELTEAHAVAHATPWACAHAARATHLERELIAAKRPRRSRRQRLDLVLARVGGAPGDQAPGGQGPRDQAPRDETPGDA
jgi:hypothetical protein